MKNSITAQYFLDHIPEFKWRDVVQEFFTNPDRVVGEPIGTNKYRVTVPGGIFVGKLITQDGVLFRVETYDRTDVAFVYDVIAHSTGIPVNDEEPIMLPQEPCLLTKGIIGNYVDDKPLETTVGRVYMNYMLFADPFGDVVPYINEPMKGGRIEAILSDIATRKLVTTEQMLHQVRNKNFIAHSPEFVAPNLTPKSLVTDPRVAQRKKELLEEYGPRIAAGDATAMSAVEQELIAMDKEWLKGDPSMRFMLKGKYFTNVRKRLLLTHGSVEKFGSAGEYTYIPNSLEEGYTQQSFAPIANEVRSGSYSRARETAKGGEESKFLLRVFQNTRITEQDCKSKRYLEVNIAPHNSGEYIYRNYMAENGKLDTVTEENHHRLEGQRIKFRSPMYCSTEGGYCYTCMGKLFENIGQKALASAANGIGSAMLAGALAKIHVGGVKVTTLGDLDDYIV